METNKFNGFSLEVIPLKTNAHFPSEHSRVILESYKTTFKGGSDDYLSFDDYNNHSQSYMYFFAATLNWLSMQMGEVGKAFLDYQQKEYFYNKRSAFNNLLRNLYSDADEYLDIEASTFVDEYLNENDPRRGEHTGTFVEKNFFLKRVLDMVAQEATKEAISKIEKRKIIILEDVNYSIPEIVVARLFLYLLDDENYKQSKASLHSNNHKGGLVFGSKNTLLGSNVKLTNKQLKKREMLKEQFKSWNSEDSIEDNAG